jgi:peptide chain release factor 2
LGGVFELASKASRVTELDKIIAEDGFWNNTQRAKEISQERSALARAVDLWNQYQRELEDLLTMHELASEDPDFLIEFNSSIRTYEGQFERYEFETIFSDSRDSANAIVTIHPGAGGTESQDWAEILLRMYTRWSERRGFQFAMLDYLPGDEAGIKSATFQVNGEYAYGYMKTEVGVHRLVRISPFDANSRRHTSFASVFVYPDIEETIEIEVNPGDIKIDVFRSSGPGGQGVNTTDSAVRLTHFPTGIVISCQNERSQRRNREIAMKILKARLYDLKMQELDAEKEKLENSKKEIAWGSQIRSYVLHPYRMIKDHRIEWETGKVDDFLDGDLDAFMETYLRQIK